MTNRIGYDRNAITYGEEMASKGRWNRFLVWAGETLDRVLRDPEAPVIPHDAPMRQGNCGVVAVCMLTDRTYAEVAQIIAAERFGRDKRRAARWNGGTSPEDRTGALATMGYTVTETRTRETLRQIADRTKGQKGRAMVRVPGHVVVVWDGLIFDQNYPAGATPDEHFSADCRADIITVRA